MKYSFLKLSFIASCLLIVMSCNQKMADATSKTNKPSIDLNNKTLAGANVLAFGPENVLFVGDSKAGVLHAVPTKSGEVKDPIPFNSFGIDRKIANKLGVAPSDLIINDMQVHPVSQEAYIAFKNGHAPNAKSLIAVISPTNNKVKFLDLVGDEIKQVSIQALRTESFNFYRDLPASSKYYRHRL